MEGRGRRRKEVGALVRRGVLQLAGFYHSVAIAGSAAAGYLSLSFASSYICYATYSSTHSASYHANTHINSRNVLGYIISE